MDNILDSEIRTRQAEAPKPWENKRNIQTDGGRWALLPSGCGPLEWLVADWGVTAAKAVDGGNEAAPHSMRVMARFDNGRWYLVEVRGPANLWGREIIVPPVSEGIEAGEDEAELAYLLWCHRAATRQVFEARRVLEIAVGTMDAIAESVDEWRADNWKRLQAR